MAWVLVASLLDVPLYSLQVVLSADLEKMYNDFLYGKVPLLWSKVGYPCLKPLSSWYPDFLARMAFLRTWMQNGNPASYWISGFFFPQV